MAELCPYQNGNAVFQVRSLVALLVEECISYEYNCQNTSQRVAHNELTSTKIVQTKGNLNPNSSTGIVTYTFNNSRECVFNFVIYDVTMREII